MRGYVGVNKDIIPQEVRDKAWRIHLEQDYAKYIDAYEEHIDEDNWWEYGGQFQENKESAIEPSEQAVLFE